MKSQFENPDFISESPAINNTQNKKEPKTTSGCISSGCGCLTFIVIVLLIIGFVTGDSDDKEKSKDSSYVSASEQESKEEGDKTEKSDKDNSEENNKQDKTESVEYYISSKQFNETDYTEVPVDDKITFYSDEDCETIYYIKANTIDALFYSPDNGETFYLVDSDDRVYYFNTNDECFYYKKDGKLINYNNEVLYGADSGKVKVPICLRYNALPGLLSDPPKAEFFIDGKSLGKLSSGEEKYLELELEEGKTYTIKASKGLLDSDTLKFKLDDRVPLFGYTFEYNYGRLKDAS